MSDSFHEWTIVADAVRGTTKRLEKLAALASYLPTIADDDALAIAARFFAGHETRYDLLPRTIANRMGQEPPRRV